MTDHATALADIAAQLLDHVRTDETFEWWPTREGLRRLHDVGAWVGDPDHDRIGKPTIRRRTTSSAGLLTQLAEHAGVRGTDVDRTGIPAATPAAGTHAGDGGPTGATKPDSKAPPGGDLVETLVDIEAGILDWRRTARRILHRPDTTSRNAPRALRELVGLAGQLPEDHARDLLRAAQTWVRTARVALAYDVPVRHLNGFHCTRPDCGSTDLRVSADADGPVRCHGRIPGPWAEGLTVPCGETYPRSTWMQLLDARLARQEIAS